ncbi:MAG TPA: CDP-alcohol phosphatidyltransferase family protein [Sumerlaeia bacterium]|nr:CDP-alcohol phosphatidyltransferase family protein [Sumerlaeia bacterium]
MKARGLKFAFVTSLTLGRAPLIGLFLVIALAVNTREHPFWFAVGFGAMILAAFTDLFDGYFARKFDMVTKLGAYADPLTDKVFYVCTLPTLVYVAGRQGECAHAAILVLLTVLLLLRDQWVSFLRSVGSLHNVDAKANWSGKWRTIVAFITICYCYWHFQAPPHFWIVVPAVQIYVMEGLTLALNLISVWVYTRRYWPSLREEILVPLKRKIGEGED